MEGNSHQDDGALAATRSLTPPVTTKLKPLITNRTNIVLFTNGSFCPIHLNHINMFITAKKYLEEKLNFNVVGGYISLSSDRQLRRKLGDYYITGFDDRATMCSLAVSDIDWLMVDLTIGYCENLPSTSFIRDFIHETVLRHYNLPIEDRTKDDCPVKMMSVIGADAFQTIRSQHTLQQGMIIVVNRKCDYDVKHYVEDAPSISRFYNKTVFLAFQIGWETTDCSSTKIRNLLLSNTDEADSELKTLLHPLVLEYIKKHNIVSNWS